LAFVLKAKELTAEVAEAKTEGIIGAFVDGAIQW